MLTKKNFYLHKVVLLGILLFCFGFVNKAISQTNNLAPVYQKDSTGTTFLQAVQRYLWTHYEPLLISKCLRRRFLMSFEFDSTKTIANFAYPFPTADPDFDMAIIEAAKTAIRSTQADWEIPENAIDAKMILWFKIDLLADCPSNLASIQPRIDISQFDIIYTCITDSTYKIYKENTSKEQEWTEAEKEAYDGYRSSRRMKLIKKPLSYLLGTCNITVTPEDLNRQRTALSRKARKRLME